MSDPLSVLRAAAKSGAIRAATLEKGKLKIGDIELDANAPTALRSKKGRMQIKAVWLLLVNDNFGKYNVACIKHRIQATSLAEKKAITLYMTGQTETCQYLDQSLLEKGEDQESGAAAGRKRKRTSEWEVADIIAREKPLLDRNTALQALGNKSLIGVLSLFQKATETAQRGKPAAAVHGGDKKAPANKAAAKPVKRIDPKRLKVAENTTPIIVAPQAITTVLNMYNVKEFMDNSVFIPSTDNKAKYPTRPTKLYLDRKSCLDPTKNARWCIMDDVKKLKPEEWRRVVAVVVLGKNWQFAEWKNHGLKTPASWFDHAVGFHFFYDDQAPVPEVANWNVTCLGISKLKRFKDKSLVDSVWKKIERHVSIRNSTRNLFY